MTMYALALALTLAAAPPPPALPPAPLPDGPVVLIKTSMGDIKIALLRTQAPKSVENFLKYTRAKSYDGTIFHRVKPDFMIQGGGMTAGLVSRPTRAPVRNEARMTPSNVRGTVAMARTNDPDSATNQFFINVRANHRLDFGIGGAGYAVFAVVTEGMDVVDRIQHVPTMSKGGYDDVPVTPVVIEQVREIALAPTAAPPAAAVAPEPPASPKPQTR
jgi:peptidyl-prolyl cis-trans isomerase A (cyclophilin A)